MRRLAATFGGASCLNQTSSPRSSRIIAPPGPTDLIVTVVAEPGCTTGEGSGVRKTLPLARPCAVILGGARSGRETNERSFSGWRWGRLSSGCAGASVATVNEKRSGLQPAILTTTFAV